MSTLRHRIKETKAMTDSTHNLPIALITGVGRAEGIGFEVARQLGARRYTVIVTARSIDKARTHAEALRSAGYDVRAMALDIASDDSVARLVAELRDTYGRLDVLIAARFAIPGKDASRADAQTCDGHVDVDGDVVRVARDGQPGSIRRPRRRGRCSFTTEHERVAREGKRLDGRGTTDLVALGSRSRCSVCRVRTCLPAELEQQREIDRGQHHREHDRHRVEARVRPSAAVSPGCRRPRVNRAVRVAARHLDRGHAPVRASCFA
jgi:hypothetical protein